MKDLFEREERYTVLPQEIAKVQQFITANVRK
jgi:threonine synthase